jgi:hypothetical protein
MHADLQSEEAKGCDHWGVDIQVDVVWIQLANGGEQVESWDIDKEPALLVGMC